MAPLTPRHVGVRTVNRLDFPGAAVQRVAMNTIRRGGAVVGLSLLVTAGCNETPGTNGPPAPQQSSTIHIFEMKQDTSPREPCTGQPVVGISIFSLYASPLAYSGKVVDVIGFITWIDLRPVLFPNEDYARARMTMMGITLDDGDAVRAACAESPSRDSTGTGCDAGLIAAEGCFVYDGSSYFGSLSGKLNIRLL